MRELIKKGVTPYSYDLSALTNIPKNIKRVNAGKAKIFPKKVEEVFSKSEKVKKMVDQTLSTREDAWGTYLGLQKGGEKILPTGLDPITGLDRYKLVSRTLSPEDARNLSDDLTHNILQMQGDYYGPPLSKTVGVDNEFGIMGGYSRFLSPDEKS